MSEDTRCSGEHDIYVAEVVGIEAECKVIVILVCRQCARVWFHEHQASTLIGASLRFLKEEKEN